jgi:hypothetical protein
MALKHVITKKEDLDQLAEPVRQQYIEQNGRWTLAVEGVAPEADLLDAKTKLAEFRDNNRTMHTELEKLRPIVEKVKKVAGDDIDTFITEHTSLKNRAKALDDKGITKPDDINAAIQAALKPVTDQLESEKQARLMAQKAADDARFRELVSADATKAGVKPQSLRHVLREASEKFELKDGSLQPKQGVKHPTDPMKDLTLSDWFQDLAKTDDYLFGESVGGGAENGNRGGGRRPGAKELVNPTPEEMGRHMDAIAKGEMIVVRR